MSGEKVDTGEGFEKLEVWRKCLDSSKEISAMLNGLIKSIQNRS